MRPVNRGSHPTLANGDLRTWKKYEDARGALIERLGEYCSYCEMHLDASLAVEHVVPKSRAPRKALTWTNFLLACTNCNSTKGVKPISNRGYFWPDRDNTFAVFLYGPNALIRIAPGLTAIDVRRAESTLELTGLDKTPGNDPKASDRRWINRHDAWGKAERAKRRLQGKQSDEMREQIVETATANGYWSVWMTVFRDDPDMRGRLIKAFTGTAGEYFR